MSSTRLPHLSKAFPIGCCELRLSEHLQALRVTCQGRREASEPSVKGHTHSPWSPKFFPLSPGWRGSKSGLWWRKMEATALWDSNPALPPGSHGASLSSLTPKSQIPSVKPGGKNCESLGLLGSQRPPWPSVEQQLRMGGTCIPKHTPTWTPPAHPGAASGPAPSPASFQALGHGLSQDPWESPTSITVSPPRSTSEAAWEKPRDLCAPGEAAPPSSHEWSLMI